MKNMKNIFVVLMVYFASALYLGCAYGQEQPIKIYMAAALFNGRETRFNLELCEALEKKGYQAFLPQRDGFNFKNLTNTLKKFLDQNEIAGAVKNIIYVLDMGKEILNTDIVVANLDEPMDEGVAVELTFARMIGKPVIGFRTDIRSPYHIGQDKLGGANFFIPYQCNYYIIINMPSQSLDNFIQEMDNLSLKISQYIEQEKSKMSKTLPQYVLANPIVQNLKKSAIILYKDIDDIHSEQNLEKIVKRYIDNKNDFNVLAPNLN